MGDQQKRRNDDDNSFLDKMKAMKDKAGFA